MPGAHQYLHGHHDSVLRSHRWRTAENSAKYLLGELRPGMSLLDVGCGPATITLDLARRVAPGHVVGVDRSAVVIEEASGRLAEAGNESTTLQVADCTALPFEDGTFDIVHAHQVLQHLDDPMSALVEMRRVCKVGGVVAARDGDISAMVWHPSDQSLDRWLAMYEAVARSVGGTPDAGRRLLGWVQAAGFRDMRASASTWCFATPEERAWWGGLWADRVTGSSLAEQALKRGMATRAELDQMARGWRRWAEHEDGWFAVVHGEVLCRVH